MKATDLLLGQHRDVDDLFVNIEDSTIGERTKLREELGRMLVAHATVERELFYPALAWAMRGSDELSEAYEEHRVVDFALRNLVSVPIYDETFEAKLEILKRLVALHVAEEEAVLIARASEELSEDDLERLGERIEKRFDDVFRADYKALLDQAVGLGRAMPKKATRRAEAKRTPRRPATAVKRTARRAATPKKTAARPAPAKRRVRRTTRT